MKPSYGTASDVMHGESRSNLRRSIWLWLYLQSEKAADFDPATCNSDNMRQITKEYLDGRDDIQVGRIQEEMTRTLLPDEDFDWIEEDARVIAWLLPRLEDCSDIRDAQSLPRLKGLNLVMGITDLWNEKLSSKAAALNRLQGQWRRHKALDSQLKWFSDKKEGISRCEYAWRWIEKNEKRSLFRPLPFGNYQELVTFFDTTDLRERERKDIVHSIRQNWNRQKYIARHEGRKQYNLMLSNDVIELLDRMAADQDKKRSEMLERLITEEAKRLAYLPQKRIVDS